MKSRATWEAEQRVILPLRERPTSLSYIVTTADGTQHEYESFSDGMRATLDDPRADYFRDMPSEV